MSAPSKAAFFAPEADGPQPITYHDDGSVTGHLAVWGSCHTGFLNGALAECVKPPESRSDYAHFHLGQSRTSEGDLVPIGKMTFATGHAPLTAGLHAATSHYDNTGSVGAFVRAKDGKHGIWISGVLRDDLSEEGKRDMLANPPSGDWRSFNGSLELIASLAVPVPGFPIMRPQLALSASGSNEVESLILPGYSDDMLVEREPHDKAYLRKRAVLAASIGGDRG